jgi:arylsulfatase A-like enzyme
MSASGFLHRNSSPVPGLTCLLLAALAGLHTIPTLAAAEKTPNIVLIFMDDMGYADPAPFGGNPELTPHLTDLAARGRRFTDFYVAQAVCSASRTALLTGCYNVRVGINPDETTLAEICRQKNYATACFGKWHLGHHRPFLPLQHGFDEYFGLPYSNDMWPFHPEIRQLPMEQRLKRWPHLPLIENNTVINPEVTAQDQAELTRLYTEKATAFIDRCGQQPFFLYLPHSMVHVPLFAGRNFQNRSGRGLFADVLMEIDWSVGQILQTLRKNNVEDNTLIIFTSDNGPWLSYGDHAGSAAPLREGKGTMFDGGCRVPCIMTWPAQIPPGTVCPAPVMTIDILPTVADLLNTPLPAAPIDGLSIRHLLVGPESSQSPHEALWFYWGNQLQAIRSGRWKLHFPHEYRTLEGIQPATGGIQPATGGIPATYRTATIEESLFDLEQDPGESNNLLAQYPEVAADLRRLAETAREQLGDGRIKGSAVRPAGSLPDETTPRN